MPGPNALCLVVSDIQGQLSAHAVCDPSAMAEKSGIFGMTGGSLFGVFPNGTGQVTVNSQGGSPETLSENSDGAIAAPMAQPLTAISYTTPSGSSNDAMVR